MVVILAQTPLEMHKNVDSRADLVKTTLMIFYCFHVSTDVELYLIHCLTDLFYVNQINFLKCPLASVDLLHDTAEHQEVLNGAESGELSGVWSPAPLLTTFSAGALSVQKHLWAGLDFCCHAHKSPGPPALTSAPGWTPPCYCWAAWAASKERVTCTSVSGSQNSAWTGVSELTVFLFSSCKHREGTSFQSQFIDFYTETSSFHFCPFVR